MKTRTARQIRERYLNYLDPNLKTEKWTFEEDQKLISILSKCHNISWKSIQMNFPGRTDVSIKNRSRTIQIKKRIPDNQKKNISDDFEILFDHENLHLPTLRQFQEENDSDSLFFFGSFQQKKTMVCCFDQEINFPQ
jgi:hypothetical protein